MTDNPCYTRAVHTTLILSRKVFQDYTESNNGNGYSRAFSSCPVSYGHLLFLANTHHVPTHQIPQYNLEAVSLPFLSPSTCESYLQAP